MFNVVKRIIDFDSVPCMVCDFSMTNVFSPWSLQVKSAGTSKSGRKSKTTRKKADSGDEEWRPSKEVRDASFVISVGMALDNE